MKRKVICQSVVRRQCCLGLTDSRPCPTPPSLGTFYIITLFFLQSLFVFDQRRPQGWESKSAFLSARFLNCTTESVEQFCLHLLLYTDVTNSQHHLSSWVLQSLVFIACGIGWSYKVRGRESEVPLSFSIYWRHKQHQQSTVNNTLQSWVLHQSHAFLARVILFNLVRTFLPSFYNSQL